MKIFRPPLLPPFNFYTGHFTSSLKMLHPKKFQEYIFSHLDTLIYLAPANTNKGTITFQYLYSWVQRSISPPIALVTQDIIQKFTYFIEFTESGRPKHEEESENYTRQEIFNYFDLDFYPLGNLPLSSEEEYIQDTNRWFTESLRQILGDHFPCPDFFTFARYINTLAKIDTSPITKDFVAWYLFTAMCYAHDRQHPDFLIRIFDAIEERWEENYIHDEHSATNNTNYKKGGLEPELPALI